MTKNLERQQQNQRRIIASISHDIKTPLTSIMGYAERLSKDNVTQERKERYLDTVYTKSVEIQQLVNEFDEYLGYNLRYQQVPDIPLQGCRFRLLQGIGYGRIPTRKARYG